MQPRNPVIMLVEDNPTLRSTLRRYLDRRFPVTLLEASSGVEAVAVARRHRVDVILLDLSLPDEPGAAVIPRLRSVRPEVRLIAMASHLERQYRDEAARAGAWASVPKELLGSQLEELLWRALPATGLTLAARVTRWRMILRASHFRSVERLVVGAEIGIGQALDWLDVHGPWAGKPRTRLLYLANVVELAFLLAVRQQIVGA